jgi:AAA domain
MPTIASARPNIIPTAVNADGQNAGVLRWSMIRLIGEEDTREHQAALTLRDLLLRRWPEVATAPEHDVCILTGAQCHGQDVRDLDIVLLASFGDGLYFKPYLPIRRAMDQSATVASIQVRSLCLVIEVKDHPVEDIRFQGTTVFVPYEGVWKNASYQSERQLYALKGYIESHGLRAPRITNLLWLRNVPNDQLPDRPHPILASPLTWETVLNVVAQITPSRQVDGAWILGVGEHDRLMLDRAAELFTRQLVPTRLDRQRMERVALRTTTLDPVRAALGQKLSILRGRGGTGKTMHLLQLANQLAEEEGARVLILTYNRALVADIRRLLTILGIGDDIVGCTVQIQTAHGFFRDMLRGLGVFDPKQIDFLDAYDRLKEEALVYIRSGALRRADIEELIAQGHESFAWDYIFVDEAQDWPEDERDLLLQLFRPGQVVVADGIDQLVRGSNALDWRAGYLRAQSHVVPLRVCLRMKAGLARFATAVARHMGLLSAEWVPNDEVPGGKVIVLDGNYLAHRALHDRLLASNAGDGNAPVDMLFCVPPSLVAHDPEGRARSVAADVFEQWGNDTWDGTASEVRESYPTALDQLRIVQYDSCRGLEGWSVVALALDDFYTHKLATHPGVATAGSPLSPEEAHLAAARWLMIPLTRAMDTLVVQIRQPYSPVRTALQAASSECGEYIEWLTL